MSDPRIPSPRGALALLPLAAALVAGCKDAAAPVIIDLGPPRPLVYVADDVAAPKHGGGSSAEAMVHVFELGGSFAPVGAFDIGAGVSEIHATPDGTHVWAVSSTSGNVAFLDTTSYALDFVDVGVNPVHAFITPDHSELWVGNDGSSDVSVISLASLSVTNTVLTGAGHHKMAFATSTAGTELLAAYVSNLTDGSISPVGPDHLARLNVVGVGPAPHGMDFSATSRRIYNCSGDANFSVEVIAVEDDATTVGVDETDTVVERISLPSRCSYLHVEDVGGYVYATLPGSDLLARIRLSDHELQTFATHDGPDRFAIVGDRAYVVHTAVATVAVIDLTGVAETTSIAVGNAIFPGSTPTYAHRSARYSAPYLFVPNEYDGTVTVIDTSSDSVVTTLTGMASPIAVAVAGPGNGTTYPR